MTTILVLVGGVIVGFILGVFAVVSSVKDY